MIFPGLGNHHHDRVRQRAAVQGQELEAVVELRRVAAIFLDDRKDFFDVVAEKLRGQHALARVHPVLVAAQGVDLAVMDQVTIRVSPPPARKRIGAEARVHHGDGGFHLRIGQVRIESHELPRRQHALINDRAVRHAGNIEKLPRRQPGVADGIFGAPANHVELALKGHVVLDTGAASDENLAHERLRGFRRIAEIEVVGRHLAPAETLLALADDDLLDDLFKLGPVFAVIRQKDHSHPVLPRIGELKT